MDPIAERELRDRIVRLEQDHKNHQDNFRSFKVEDFTTLKHEVHQMHQELNKKIDSLVIKVDTKVDEIKIQISTINMQIAKWAGGIAVLTVLLEISIRKFF